MTDDFEFISNVRALSDNGTLARVLDMMTEDAIEQWKASGNVMEREERWHEVRAIQALRDKIKSLTTDEKVRQFNNRRYIRELRNPANQRSNDE